MDRHSPVTDGALPLNSLEFTQEKRARDDSQQVPHESASAHIASICVAILVLLDACSFDESKLRRHGREDAASTGDVAASPADTARAGGDAVAGTDVADGSRDLNGAAVPDGAAAGGADGGLGGAGGSGLDVGAADRPPGSDGQGSSEEARAPAPVDTAGLYDGGAADRPALGEDATDAPSTEDSGTDDRGGQTMDVPAGADVVDAAPDADDSGAGSDARDDAMSVDARGKKTCPTTIGGSLDRSDSTQIGRLSRTDSASACGTRKDFPGNGADRMYSHLYDVYHFINDASTPVCFTFTLTYSSYQELYVAAYSAFDPTDITTGYLGDVGDILTPPQTMGITVGPAETIDVVVYAVAIGTSAAGAYTLSCSTQ